MKLSGVILAAGLSRRMGFPKALLLWKGETYLDRMIRIFGGVCDEVIIVLRPGGIELLSDCVRLTEARIALNPDANRGQLSSLQAGLAAVSPASPGVLFSPVDYAHVREESVARVVSLIGSVPEPVVQPEYQGKHGHPVAMLRTVMEAVTAAAPEGQARDVVRTFPRRFVAVDDPGVLLDADDPETFRLIQECAK